MLPRSLIACFLSCRPDFEERGAAACGLPSRSREALALTAFQQFVEAFAVGLSRVDARRPVAVNQRSGVPFSPGIGPHTEAETVRLVLQEMATAPDSQYRDAYALEVPYPTARRSKCDLCLGHAPDWDWCIEVKMLRLMGDNGKPNDNILMHILSPYPQHRSAVTDCAKLLGSGLSGRKALVIFGYEYLEWPLEPTVAAFEVLAGRGGALGPRVAAAFSGLIHPVHRRGAVFGWALSPG